MSLGKRFSITDIKRALIDKQKDSIRTRTSNAKNGGIDIVSSLSFEDNKVLKNILLSETPSERISYYKTRQTFSPFLASAYVSAQRPLFHSDSHSSTSIYITLDSWRQLQCVLTELNFYGNQNRTDAVAIESCQSCHQFPPTTSMFVWFGKTLLFLRLVCLSEELCFVCYYQLLSPTDLEADDEDPVFYCVRIQ